MSFVTARGGMILEIEQRVYQYQGQALEVLGRFRIDFLGRLNNVNVLVEGKGVPWRALKYNPNYLNSFLDQLTRQTAAFSNATQAGSSVIQQRVIVLSSKAPEGFAEIEAKILQVVGKYDKVFWSIEAFDGYLANL
jgi:hypothetical protein